jgi:hypothetical protein
VSGDGDIIFDRVQDLRDVTGFSGAELMRRDASTGGFVPSTIAQVDSSTLTLMSGVIIVKRGVPDGTASGGGKFPSESIDEVGVYNGTSGSNVFFVQHPLATGLSAITSRANDGKEYGAWGHANASYSLTIFSTVTMYEQTWSGVETVTARPSYRQTLDYNPGSGFKFYDAWGLTASGLWYVAKEIAWVDGTEQIFPLFVDRVGGTVGMGDTRYTPDTDAIFEGRKSSKKFKLVADGYQWWTGTNTAAVGFTAYNLGLKTPGGSFGTALVLSRYTQASGAWAEVLNIDGALSGSYVNALLPNRAKMWHSQSRPLTGNALVVEQVAAQRHGERAYQGTPADANSFTTTFDVAAGTYSITVLGQTFSVGAKIDWYMDNVSVSTGQDWYSNTGSDVSNVVKTIAASITLAAGRHVLKGVVNGKNASSSGYYLSFTCFDVTSTSAD